MATQNAQIKTILIAEDDDLNFKFLEIIIRMAGYNVLWAENGVIAVDICREQHISLVLMDIRMPWMDGLEATKIIRSFNPTIPVIAQTAYALSGDHETARKAGCTMFITKPIDRKTVLSIIEELLQNENAEVM